jgi:hypothetical protein
MPLMMCYRKGQPPAAGNFRIARNSGEGNFGIKIAQPPLSAVIAAFGDLLPCWEAGRTATEMRIGLPYVLTNFAGDAHPTRDAADILIYRFEECGPIKSKLVVPNSQRGRRRF